MRYLDAHECRSIHDNLRQDGGPEQVHDDGVGSKPLEIMTEDFGSFIFFQESRI